jgi:predicted RNA polymerase sigma factor
LNVPLPSLDDRAEQLLRELAPQVLGAMIRRYRDFAASEDAVQEALLAAALQWPRDGLPDNPRGWLIHVASRRITDHVRSESARRRRENEAAAAIAAVHDEAALVEDTDWRQIVALYGVLKRLSDNPMVTLNHAIAAAMVEGPAFGLTLLDALEAEGSLRGHYRLDAVRAHLLELSGDHERAVVHYRKAADRTASIPERDYLITQAARLNDRLT